MFSLSELAYSDLPLSPLFHYRTSLSCVNLYIPLTTFIPISRLFIALNLAFSLQDASFAQIRMFARGVFRGQKESSKSMPEMQTQEMQSTYS